MDKYKLKTDPIPVKLDRKEEALQRIASSLERLEIILLQLAGRKIRFSASEHPVHEEQTSTESSTD